MIRLSTVARDGGVYGVTISFKDDAGAAVVPTSATWSLRNGSKAIVNDREDIAIIGLSDSATLVLTGDDLMYSDGAARYITVSWTYDSATLGNGVTDNDEIYFTIENLIGI